MMDFLMLVVMCVFLFGLLVSAQPHPGWSPLISSPLLPVGGKMPTAAYTHRKAADGRQNIK